MTKEHHLLIKNELEYLKFKKPHSKLNYKTIYNKYQNTIDASLTHLDLNVKLVEKMYCFVNDIKNYNVCAYCNKNIVKRFVDYNKGYGQFCCVKCLCYGTQEKKKVTYKNKTGYEHPSHNPEVEKKKIETSRRNYGTDYPLQNKKCFKDKQKKYFLKYGVYNPLQNEIVKNKKNTTCKERYKGQNKKLQLSKEQICERSQIKFGNKFKLIFHKNFKGQQSIITILCPIHGKVELTSQQHLSLSSGCVKCKVKSNGEFIIENILKNNDIIYEAHYNFKDCSYKRVLPFDFYIPERNICIEYDGKQHYKFIKYYHKTYDKFEEQQLKDNIKTKYCEENNIQLIRIPYWKFDDIEKIIIDQL